MSDDVLWKLEPATEAKHWLYKRFLDAWWPKLLQPSKTGYLRPYVTYVDAFAGPGRYLGGEEGTPVFVLDRLLNHTNAKQMSLNRVRVRLVFIEKDRARFAHLREELGRKFGDLDRLPVRVELRRGDAATETLQALNDLRAWGQPILAIFDSWGNVNIPLDLIKKIGHNRSSEAIVTFGPNWFSRRQDLDASQLDVVFGGREYWEPADRECEPEERWRAWLATYRDALRRAGFDYRLQFQILTKRGLPLYLVYGTSHHSGVESMKDAMWKVDESGGRIFKDPRTRGGGIPLGQGDLFGSLSAADPELLELVTERLADGPTTVADLRDWLLRETARWRAEHATPALNELRVVNAISIDPPEKRITKSTIIRLRR